MKNKQPVATYSISNNLTVLIYGIEYGINDYAIWKYSNEDKFHKSTIHYYQHNNNRAFFSFCGKRYYLDEFIRL